MQTIFALRMKTLRKEYGYTQSDVANLLEIGQTTIANYENGSRVPDIAKLSKIADLYQVSVDYLLGRTRERTLIGMASEPTSQGQHLSYEDYMESLLLVSKKRAKDIVTALLQGDLEPDQIYEDYIRRSLRETGDLWERGIVSIWKEHSISEISLEMMALLKKGASEEKHGGKPVLAFTPGAEVHSIGLRMLSDQLEARGFDVIFLGTGIPTENILQAIEDRKPQAILISVTMPYNVDSAKNLITRIRETLGGMAPKVFIGGEAFENVAEAAKFTGADKYCTKFNDLLKNLKKI